MFRRQLDEQARLDEKVALQLALSNHSGFRQPDDEYTRCELSLRFLLCSKFVISLLQEIEFEYELPNSTLIVCFYIMLFIKNY